jgi:hypothetical protein
MPESALLDLSARDVSEPRWEDAIRSMTGQSRIIRASDGECGECGHRRCGECGGGGFCGECGGGGFCFDCGGGFCFDCGHRRCGDCGERRCGGCG